MDESLLTALFVPTTDETGKDFNGQRGERAVGYPVGKGLILTAGRILETGSPYYRDKCYPVTLCRHHDGCDDDSDWIKITEDDIKWRGKDDLDAALIYCDRLLDIVDWGIVSSEKPPPDCMDRHGELLSTMKGISGMPVFVGRKIFGVVRSIPPTGDANTLYATPTWKLLEDTAFRKAIGYDEQVKHLDSVKGDLAKALARSPEAIDMLVERLRLNKEMDGLDHTQRARLLAERLLPEIDSCVVIDTLRDVHRSLCEDSETAEQEVKAAEIVAKAAQLIVPAVYDYGVVKWTRSQKDSEGVAPVPLPAGIRTVAEIIMAGVDERKTKFRHRRTERDYPEGELSLPQLPEGGIDPGGANARQALQKHLEGKFIPAKAGEFRRTVDDYLIATKYPSEPGKEGIISWEQRIKPTADQIARVSRDSKQTFYLVLPLPEDVEGENVMRSLAKSLKKDYSAIMFLSLDPTSQQEKQDRDLVYPFCCMLPLQRGDSAAVATKPWPETTDSSSTAPQKEPSAMRFKIALSYPGERRDFVEQVAARLADQVGRDRVLYDRYYEAEFARPDLDTYLQRLYHDESELIAVFLCADYERKDWCGLEWRAVRDLIKQRQAATVMPFRFDNTEIPGLFSIDGYIWIGGRLPQEIADLILQRMESDAKRTPASSPSSTPTSPTPTPPPPGLQTWREKLSQVVKRFWE